MPKSPRTEMHRKKTKSFHVLYTGFVYKKVITGGDQLILDIVPRLPKNIDITIVTPSFTKDYWKGIDTSRTTFIYLPQSRFDFKSNPLLIFMAYVARAIQVHKVLKKQKIETLYSCSDIAYADIWPAFLYRRKNPNVKWLSRVYHILIPPQSRKGNYFVNAVAYWLQKLSFKMMKSKSTTIFALNDKLFKDMLKMGFPKDRLEVLGAGIDYQGISNFKPKKKYDYDVVALGRLTPVKGIYDTIEVWTKVHKVHPEAKFAWIGGGSDVIMGQLQQKLTDKSLTDSFKYLGFVDKDEVYSILKNAKIFICPDHENGWGLAVCEAMASGLPVVGYDLDIFGSVYKQGFITAPLYDTEAFADRIVTLLSDEKLRKKLAGEAKKQVREFDHTEVVDKLVQYI